MDKEKILKDIRLKETQLQEDNERLVKDEQVLRDLLDEFDWHQRAGQRQLWDSFEVYESSRNFFDHIEQENKDASQRIMISYQEDLENIQVKRRKIDDELNDLYHKKVKINQAEEEQNGN